ncbi:MAG: amino acid ABC transporter permease [Sphaerochaetaceae bacterium]|jgi:His/Glu/Gln/Arg/opine family amino acid ABC transporter permease subunit|nr:amino acid ABC transporter permease [Bacteroidia bacterium]
MELSKHLITWRLLIVQGLPQTLKLALVSLALSFVVGVLLGVIRSRKWIIINQILGVYLGVIRGIPFLLLLLLIYFTTPIRDIFIASVVTLTVFNSSYISEIIAGGIDGLSQGQFKAGKSLGMNGIEVMCYVILPQVLNLTMPALLGQMVILIKGTATCSAIGYVEITRTGTVAMEAFGNPQIIYIYVMILYFVMCHALTVIGRKLEIKGKLKMIGKA